MSEQARTPGTPPGVEERVRVVEETFGDPWNPENPVSFAAVVAADEAETLLPEAVEVFGQLQLAAEFVPADLGGRLETLEDLGRVIRTVIRRDAALVAGLGLSAFTGGAPVWVSGNDDQRRRVADVLLSGGRLGVVCPELDHANDFFSDAIGATREGDTIRVCGAKTAVNNADDAEVLVAFTEAGPAGSEGHNLVLLDRARVSGGTIRPLGRLRTNGTRGLQFGGLAFDDCLFPSDALIGEWGQGFAAGAPAFAVLHATAPAAVIGMGDTALRVAARYALREWGASVPAKVRAALAGSFADLLVADSLAVVAARSVHLLPAECNALCAVAKYLVPKVLGEVLFRLSVVLGDSFHAGHGDEALLRKTVRDLSTVTFGHVSTALCQATMAPYLPGLARQAWGELPPPPRELFAVGTPVPPLDPPALGRLGGRDGLVAVVHEVLRDWYEPGAAHLDALLATQCKQVAEEVDNLQDSYRAVFAGPAAGPGPAGAGGTARIGGIEGPGGTAPDDDGLDAAAPLIDRYAIVLAAASALGVWRHARENDRGFLGEPEWLAAALDRLLRRSGRQGPDLPPRVEASLMEHVLRRVLQPQSYDVFATRLAG